MPIFINLIIKIRLTKYLYYMLDCALCVIILAGLIIRYFFKYSGRCSSHTIRDKLWQCMSLCAPHFFCGVKCLE